MYVCISNMVSSLNRERDGEGDRKEKKREEKISTVMNVEP